MINDRERVLNVRDPYLLDLMWPLLAAGKRSYAFKGRWFLFDQIIVSSGIVNGKGGWRLAGAAQIEAMALMSKPGSPGRRRFGLAPPERDRDGFSDHYPVSVLVEA